MNIKRTITTVAAAFTLMAAYGTAYAAPGDGPGSGYFHGPGMMWDDQWGGFGMILGPIFMILVLVGIVAGVIYLLRMAGWQHPTHVQGHTAADDRAMLILRERFAKGEIDSKEYEERKSLLKG